MLRDKINSTDKPAAIGAFIGLAAPPLVQVIGQVGFDFVLLDAEHGVFTPESLEACLGAAAAIDLPAIVRTADDNPCQIQAALDGGAQGIQVPSVESAGQARRIVAASRFPPHGRRGFGSTTRAAGYGFIPRPQVVETADRQTLVIVQIESRRGIDNLAEIAAVDGVDLVFLGTNDLSLDYGFASPADPAMLPLLGEAIGRIREAGKVSGVHLADPGALPQMRDLGVAYFTVVSLALMRRGLQDAVTAFRQGVGRP